ncbi:hypothetical protein PUN28_001218 [Cardiocondyla obscurior]|uniref:Uncharacterized protein n=1 Tax=Cardiocondyla obscurior TaxID=286306 RepID=A0AAW2H3X7_9HYME
MLRGALINFSMHHQNTKFGALISDNEKHNSVTFNSRRGILPAELTTGQSRSVHVHLPLIMLLTRLAFLSCSSPLAYPVCSRRTLVFVDDDARLIEGDNYRCTTADRVSGMLVRAYLSSIGSLPDIIKAIYQLIYFKPPRRSVNLSGFSRPARRYSCDLNKPSAIRKISKQPARRSLENS